jgi:DNA-binding beta-propeller fold protein YncE
MKNLKYFSVFFVIMITSCLKDKYTVDTNNSGYPDDINRIITYNCSKSGCHNTASKDAADGLDLSSWENMFNGGSTGAVTVPYSTQFSPLLYFTNTDSTNGDVVAKPTMPYNQAPLSRTDYLTLRKWIEDGAPDKTGFVKFSDNPARRKIYITNQGCDNVAVLDAERKVIMRYVEVGVIPGAVPAELPHMIKVTPDNKLWIVIFVGGGIMQVFDASTDVLLKNISIGAGQWNTFTISSDSKKAYAADFSSGKIVFVNLETLAVEYSLVLPSSFSLHGTALNAGNDTLYQGLNNNSNILFKIPVNDPANYEVIDLNVSQPVSGFLNPHEIIFSPDFSMYFVSCEGPNANQVRVYATSDDHLIQAINVGIKPVEMSISPSKNLLFVTCMEDQYFAGVTGSVRVIDINTLAEIKRIRAGWQPHGIAVDEDDGMVYIANRNFQGNTPVPHHPAPDACNGNTNGNISVIDLNTLEINNSVKAELSVDPYGVAYRK